MDDKYQVSEKLADDSCTIEDSSPASEADGNTAPVPHVKTEVNDVKMLVIFCVLLLSSVMFFSVYYSIKLNHKEEDLEELRNANYILTSNRDILEAQAIQQSQCKRNNSDLQEILGDVQSECDTKYSDLQEMLDNLKSKCGTNYGDLQEKLDNLKSECKRNIIALLKSRDTLESKYAILKEKYDKLTKKFNDLKKYYCDATNTSPENICSFCKPLWDFFGSKCYFISSNQLTWKESRDWCRRRGGRLVNIESLEERDFIKSKGDIVGGNVEYWIGRYDITKENTTTKMDGGPIKSERPSDDDKEECLGMQLGLNKVLSNNCETLYYWICESAPFLVRI